MEEWQRGEGHRRVAERGVACRSGREGKGTEEWQRGEGQIGEGHRGVAERGGAGGTGRREEGGRKMVI